MSKFVLIKLTLDEISQLVKVNRLKVNYFTKRFLVDIQKDYGVGILQIVHRNSIYSKPPEDGKLRKLQPDYQWLTINDQLLVPIFDYHETEPLLFSTIYSTEP